MMAAIDDLAGAESYVTPDDALPLEAVVAKRRLSLGFWLALAWVVLIVALAVLAPVLPLDNPEESFTSAGRLSGPSGDHWFGLDANARDVFSRTLWAARVSLVVGFAAIAFGFVVGGTLGLVAGYLKGWADKVISFVFAVLLSFPALVLAILITSLLDRNLRTISLTLGILAIAPVGRLARANTLVYAEREFVTAAKTIGAKSSRIMIREILPNVVIPMSALALLGMAVAIVGEGGLAFLGLSVESGSTWGKMIVEGTDGRTLRESPHVAMFPILFLFLTVLALNFAGDRLRAFLDVKELSI
jgi:peptide/nickel transport system permease protein